MADDDLTLKLDDETRRRLEAAADAAGVPVDTYVAGIVRHSLDDDWAEDERIVREYERTGGSYSLEEGLAAFDAAVRRRFENR
jgi:hypothetical protein